MNIPRIKQNLVFGFVVVLFISAVLWGLQNGIKAAKSKSVLNNAKTLTTAVGYFYEDQGRYPTGLEFADKKLMAAYLSNLPVQQFTAQTCNENFFYSNPFPKQFELNVCLLKKTGQFVKGWNYYSKSE